MGIEEGIRARCEQLGVAGVRATLEIPGGGIFGSRDLQAREWLYEQELEERKKVEAKRTAEFERAVAASEKAAAAAEKSALIAERSAAASEKSARWTMIAALAALAAAAASAITAYLQW